MSPAFSAWLGNPSPRVVDAGLTVVVGVPVVASTVISGVEDDRALLGVLFGIAAVAPLLVRRRWPFATLAAILAVAVVAPVDGQYALPLVVALYTIGSRRSWELTIAGAASVVATGFAYQQAGGPDLTTEDLMATALLCAVAAGVGLYVGSKRASMDALSERAERLHRERELLAERAVAEERVRIAQELHDVVAHNVSLIVVQAQALGATVHDDRVAEATEGIAVLGRRAMAEMHRTLKLLRGSEEQARRTPQPGLADLDDLLERARAAGLRIELSVEGEPRPLAQSVDLSAYRIVQEGLTNTLKHGLEVTRATVTLRYRPDDLCVEVCDDGAASSSGGGAEARTGHGLIGMRERVAMYGGELFAGPRTGGGFEVRARFPLEPEAG